MIYAGFRVTPGPGQGLALMPLVARVNQLVSKHGGKPIANFAVAFGGPGSGDHIHIFGYQAWAAVRASGPARGLGGAAYFRSPAPQAPEAGSAKMPSSWASSRYPSSISSSVTASMAPQASSGAEDPP